MSLLRAPRRGRAAPIIAPTQERPPLLFDASQGMFVTRPMARPSVEHPHASADARLLRPADTVAPQPLRSPGVPSPLQLAQAGVVSAPDGASFSGDSSGAIEPMESERPAPGHAPGTPPDRPADLMAPPRPLGMDEAFRGSGRQNPLSSAFDGMVGNQVQVSEHGDVVRSGFGAAVADAIRRAGGKLPNLSTGAGRAAFLDALAGPMKSLAAQFREATAGLSGGAHARALRDFKQRLTASIYTQMRDAWKQGGRKPPKPTRRDAEKFATDVIGKILGGATGASGDTAAPPPAPGGGRISPGVGSDGRCPCPCRPVGGDIDPESGSDGDDLDGDPGDDGPGTRGNGWPELSIGGAGPPSISQPSDVITPGGGWGGSQPNQLANWGISGADVVIGPGGGGPPSYDHDDPAPPDPDPLPTSVKPKPLTPAEERELQKRLKQALEDYLRELERVYGKDAAEKIWKEIGPEIAVLLQAQVMAEFELDRLRNTRVPAKDRPALEFQKDRLQLIVARARFEALARGGLLDTAKDVPTVRSLARMARDLDKAAEDLFDDPPEDGFWQELAHSPAFVERAVSEKTAIDKRIKDRKFNKLSDRTVDLLEEMSDDYEEIVDDIESTRYWDRPWTEIAVDMLKVGGKIVATAAVIGVGIAVTVALGPVAIAAMTTLTGSTLVGAVAGGAIAGAAGGLTTGSVNLGMKAASGKRISEDDLWTLASESLTGAALGGAFSGLKIFVGGRNVANVVKAPDAGRGVVATRMKNGSLQELRPSRGGVGPNRWQTAAPDVPVHAGQESAVRSGTRAWRFFYDPRNFKREVSPEYWAGVDAKGASLHHWLIPQSATWVPEGIRNAGFNLVVLPGGRVYGQLSLNSWMGFAQNWGTSQRLLAGTVENAFRVLIPGSLVGGGYGGYLVGRDVANDRR